MSRGDGPDIQYERWNGDDPPPSGQGWTFSGGQNGSWQRPIAKAPDVEENSGGGGGGGGKGGPLAAISNAVSSVGNAVTSAVTAVGKTVDAIVKNPLPMIETAALVYVGVPPTVASAAVSAMNGGSVEDVATAAVTAYAGGEIASAVGGSAGGTIAAATEPAAGAYIPSATTSTLVKVASSAVGADVAATTIALSQGKDLTTALDVGTKAAVSSVISSAASEVGSTAASKIDNATAAQIAGSTVAGGTAAALTGKDVLSSALASGGLSAANIGLGSAFNTGMDAVKSAISPTPAPVVDTSKTAGLSPAQISSRIDNIIEQAPGVQTAGALPLAEMTTSAALQQAEPLIRLVAEAANDPNYKVLLPAIEQRLGQLGLTIAEVASRLNPAVLAAQLATYSPNAGDPNEDAKMAQIYKEIGIAMPRALTPLEAVNLQPRPVAPLDITPNETQAETERLARQNQQVPAPAPEEPVTVVRVDPNTGEALVMKPSGEIFTVTVDPSTKPGSTISVPSPAAAPSPAPAPAPAPSPSPAPEPAPRPAPEPSPVPEPVPAPKPVPKPITPPPSGLAPSPISKKDRQVIELTKPPSAPPLTKEQVSSGEYFYNAPGGFAKDEGVAPEQPVYDYDPKASKQPVYDYDPKAKPPSDVFTKTVLSPKTKSSAALGQALGQALGTTGLAAYRGAGEIEAPGTGKARRKVWNEESLKLKDALGV
jgi:hypothetical protein